MHYALAYQLVSEENEAIWFTAC